MLVHPPQRSFLLATAVVVAVVCSLFDPVSTCFITNCPRGGKRNNNLAVGKRSMNYKEVSVKLATPLTEKFCKVTANGAACGCCCCQHCC